MNDRKYSRTQIALHWLSALYIVWGLVMGFYVSLFHVTAELKASVAAMNISLAALFTPLFIIRLYLRFHFVRHRRPKTAEPLVSFVHNLVYLIVSLVLLSGVLMMDRPIEVFGLLTLPQPIHDPAWLNGFKKVHLLSNSLLAMLISLHVLAVIKHEVTGTRVLKRMTFRI
jgi:cytochrome b561